jgi:cell division protein FtsI (penicillin-binding protein 3)
MAAFVLGYVDRNGNGLIGMEQVLDARLKDPAMRGQPVALSIDARVQGAGNELAKQIAASNARGGGGIVPTLKPAKCWPLRGLVRPQPAIGAYANSSGLMHNDDRPERELARCSSRSLWRRRSMPG